MLNVKVLNMQRNLTSTFYGLGVKIEQNGLLTSFTEVHYFASHITVHTDFLVLHAWTSISYSIYKKSEFVSEHITFVILFDIFPNKKLLF